MPTIECTKCYTMFIWQKKSCKLCRDCKNKNNIDYFSQLVRSSKYNSKVRENNGRNMGISVITLDDLLQLHEKQKGRCYYSGITYSFVNKSNWQCSLERLDPNIGYVVGNIALVIIELNNASQWSLEKIKCFIDISYTIHEYQHIDFTFDTSKSLRGLIHIKKKETNINDIQYIKCNKCDTFKTIDFFLKKSSYGCKPCRDMDRRHANNNPRRHMQNMICHMIKHTKERNKKGRGHGLCEYTFDDIVKLWGEQGGLCAYSRIPMTFGSHKDMWWTCSPERIDETKGYIKGNVCLICHEFNTSTQWSKAKVDFLKSALSAKKI